LAGQIIRYEYLWSDEADRGLEEGAKWRPCALILVIGGDDDEVEVVVAPITHRPASDAVTVPIPAKTRRRIGLDDAAQWIVVSDLNRFRWPGPDLRPVSGGGDDSVVMGLLPAALLGEVKSALIELLKSGRTQVVARTE
jgi:hypothetical protein